MKLSSILMLIVVVLVILLAFPVSSVLAQPITVTGELREIDYASRVQMTKNRITLTFDPKGGSVRGDAEASYTFPEDGCSGTLVIELEGTYRRVREYEPGLWGGEFEGKAEYHFTTTCESPSRKETFKTTWAAHLLPTDNGNSRIDGAIIGRLGEGWVPSCRFRIEMPKREEKGVKIFGRAYLDDAAKRYPYGPVRNAKVELEHKGKEYVTFTDNSGLFEFNAEKLGIKFTKDDQIKLTLHLEDKVDNKGVKKNYIEIVDRDSANTLYPAYIEKEGKITDADLKNGEKEVNFDFDKKTPASGYRSGSNNSVLPGLIKEYIIFEDAVAFALEKLNADIESVSIYTNDPNAKTACLAPHYGESAACYEPANKRIHLGTDYIKFWPNQKSGAPSPDVEFHEFGHHIMFCHKDYTPAIPYTIISHGGMMNQTTHDSLCEGEADFMALIMREYKGLNTSKKGVTRGENFEVNYKAWLNQNGINKEDVTVASLLWDLYDAEDPAHPERLDDEYYFPSQNKVYDKIDLSLKDLWSIIRSSGCKNVLNLYTMLTTKYPSDKEKINNLFIAHALFRDKDRGDGQYNGPQGYLVEPLRVSKEGKLEEQYFAGEPFHDKNNNQVRDPATEPFVDLGHGHKFPGGQVYDADEDIVGTASNYLMFGTPTKSGRQIKPIVQNSHILVKNEGEQEFLVKVEFEPEYSYYNYQYLANSYQGLLYIPFPPPEYETTVAITPISKGHLAEKPLEIASGEYYDLMSKSTGENHFLEHEFDLSPIKKEAHVSGLAFESRSKPSGSDVQIPLTLKEIEETTGNMDITLSYDPSVLKATEVIKGSLTRDSLFEHNILEGTIKISLADSEGFTGDGSIAYIKFNVIGAEGSSSPLRIVEISANRADDYDVLDIATKDGVFKVISSEELKGDCNGDERITTLDALCALQMAVGKRAEDLVIGR